MEPYVKCGLKLRTHYVKRDRGSKFRAPVRIGVMLEVCLQFRSRFERSMFILTGFA